MQKLQKSREDLLHIKLQDGTEIDDDEVLQLLSSSEPLIFSFYSNINSMSSSTLSSPQTETPYDEEGLAQLASL